MVALCHVCLAEIECPACSPETVQMLAGGPTDGVESPAVSPCHCARILPALRRWLEARDAWIRNDQSRTNVDEVLCASAELEVLARELLAERAGGGGE